MAILTTVLLIISYFSVYEKECGEALQFIAEHSEIRTNLEELLGSDEDATLAVSVVLPEISQYTYRLDRMQSRMMFVLYVQNGIGNFSIGSFQMKPSFAQGIENIVARDEELQLRFGNLVIEDNDQSAVRYERIKRLCTLEWQIRYLAAFYKIAERKVSDWPLSQTSKIKKLQYISSLYNGGLNLSYEDVCGIMRKFQFPYMRVNQFNYSDCSVEFYNKLLLSTTNQADQ